MTTSRARETQAVPADPTPAEEPEAVPDEGDDLKCMNHPHRKALRYTGGGAYDLLLCSDCAPAWFTPVS